VRRAARALGAPIVVAAAIVWNSITTTWLAAVRLFGVVE
jgi:hypothetical protein